ncbi:MAG TPA: hypothetical protein VEA61_12905 [Allosphingosinicella sp.]|nr:hypothetical protein [Allosphingosinicella sp.]
MRELPPGRVATLEAGAFLVEPAGALGAAARLFGLAVDEAAASAIASGPVFREHAKRPGRAFDASVQKREEAVAKFAYGAEIDAALEWAGTIAAEAGVPPTLEAPLLG